MKNCSKCLREISETDQKCTYCGTYVMQNVDDVLEMSTLDNEPSTSFDSFFELLPASRAKRFWARTIDSLISLAFMIPFFYYLNSNSLTMDWQKLLSQDPIALLLYLPAFIASYALIAYFLKKNGQTIGKKVMNIKIVTFQENTVPQLRDSLLKRELLVFAIIQIPVIGAIFSLIDSCMILGPEKLTLHDRIAGTRVVQFSR